MCDLWGCMLEAWSSRLQQGPLQIRPYPLYLPDAYTALYTSCNMYVNLAIKSSQIEPGGTPRQSMGSAPNHSARCAGCNIHTVYRPSDLRHAAFTVYMLLRPNYMRQSCSNVECQLRQQSISSAASTNPPCRKRTSACSRSWAEKNMHAIRAWYSRAIDCKSCRVVG